MRRPPRRISRQAFQEFRCNNMAVVAKICGLTSREAVEAVAKGGAAYAGFVFFPPSPRNVQPAEAGELARHLPAGITKVGVVVDPTDLEIELILAEANLDIIQLHGDETPERVAEIRRKFGLRVMKAVPIAGAADILRAKSFEAVADLLLFDAKPPKSMLGSLPGGNGLAFDWKLVASTAWKRPWMLSGGLDAATVGNAVRISGAGCVDVSSGVESAPGVKNPALIEGFLAALRGL